jgi:hypothetical protein
MHKLQAYKRNVVIWQELAWISALGLEYLVQSMLQSAPPLQVVVQDYQQFYRNFLKSIFVVSP